MMKQLLAKNAHRRDNSHPHFVAWTLVLCNVMLIMGSDIHLPALPNLVADLNTTEFLGQMVFMMFFVGASFSRLIWGPVSDKIGRRKVLFILLGVQIPSQFMCMIADNIYSLLFWRAFQSLGAGVVSVVGTAIIADLFKEKERAKYYALLELSFPIGFIIAPVLGAYLLEMTGTWRTGFQVYFVALILILLICYFVVPETNKSKNTEAFRLNAYFKVIGDLRFFVFTSVVSLIVASYVLYVVNAPFIFITDYHVSPTLYAIYQLLPMVFNFLGLLLYRYVLVSRSIYEASALGMKSLIIVLPIYFIIAIDLFPIEPWVIVLAVCIQSLIVPLVIPGLTSMAMDLFPNSKGLASSCIAGFRSFYQVMITILFSYFVASTANYVFMMKFLIVGSAIASFLWFKSASQRD